MPAETYSSFVTRWFDEEASRLRLRKIRATSLDKPERKAAIEFESEGSLILIEVWDDLRCVDITVMDTLSRESLGLGWGECADLDDLRARLSGLGAWLDSRARAQQSD